MKKPSIQIRRPGNSNQGYKVSVSRKRPSKTTQGRIFDVWIPTLAPDRKSWENYLKKRISWDEFTSGYWRQLYSVSSQDIIKQLALLSLRRTVVLLCNCSDLRCCPETILARAIEECRKNGNFVMSF